MIANTLQIIALTQLIHLNNLKIPRKFHHTRSLLTKVQCIVEIFIYPFSLHFSDLALLKTHYHTILQLMSDNYEQNVGKLQHYFSDDQICVILSSGNSSAANKMILDCLIERLSCREGLLDLCNQLDTICASHQLMMVISEIRSGW